MKTDNIFLLMAEKNITAKELSKETGISAGNISDWKSGRSSPKTEALIKIANYFNVSADYLMGIEADSKEISEARKNAKSLYAESNIPFDKIEQETGANYATFAAWCNGFGDYFNDKIYLLADLFNVSSDSLFGRENANTLFASEAITYMEVIGAVRAGYDGTANEEHTGEFEPIPTAFLRGGDVSDFFVLRVSGNSMYPRILDGDLVLVKRESSVDSGSIAVVLYGNEEATVKTVRYTTERDGLDLVPANPEYETKHIEGSELEKCLILGKVVKLIRDL